MGEAMPLGWWKWNGGVTGPDGRIYGIPHDRESILIIDPVAGTASTSAMGASLTGDAKWLAGTLGSDGKIYGIPGDSTTILIIDPVAGTATRSNMGASLSGAWKWLGGVLGPDGRIYGIPLDSTNILVIDPAAGTATRSTMGASLSGSAKWSGGVLGPDGKIYGIPGDSTTILIIDPVAGTATRSNMGASLSGAWKWSGGVLGSDGKIYGIPANSTNILIIDPIAGTATRSNMGASLSGTEKWSGGVLAPDGKIYGIPGGSNDILIIDPIAGTATRSNMGASIPGDTDQWIGGALGPDGQIYAIPFEMGDILIIEADETGCADADGCDDPPQPSGTIVYSSNHRVMQWCDGLNWQALGPINPPGPNDGCVDPVKPGGNMLFSRTYCVLQYCDGDTWRGIGELDPCACNAPTGDLVAHWPLDEGSGPTANDVSGNANHGTLSGGPARVAGHIGTGALEFDATNDRVSIANESNFDFNRTNAFTIATWLRQTGPTSHGIVGKWIGTPGYGIYSGLNGNWFDSHQCSGNCIIFGMQNASSQYMEVMVNNAITFNTWTHVVATYDGSSARSGMLIYLNGAPATTVPIGQATLGGSILNNDAFRIGAFANSSVYYGRLDDVRVYSGALSPAQVQELYNTGDVALPCP